MIAGSGAVNSSEVSAGIESIGGRVKSKSVDAGTHIRVEAGGGTGASVEGGEVITWSGTVDDCEVSAGIESIGGCVESKSTNTIPRVYSNIRIEININ